MRRIPSGAASAAPAFRPARRTRSPSLGSSIRGAAALRGDARAGGEARRRRRARSARGGAPRCASLPRMKRIAVAFLAASAALAEEPRGETQETLYAMGALLGRRVQGAKLTAKE